MTSLYDGVYRILIALLLIAVQCTWLLRVDIDDDTNVAYFPATQLQNIFLIIFKFYSQLNRKLLRWILAHFISNRIEIILEPISSSPQETKSTLCFKKRHPLYFMNNSVKRELMLIKFDMQYRQETYYKN